MKIYNKDKIVSVKIYRGKVCEDIVYRNELRILWGKILLREKGYYDYRITNRKIDNEYFRKYYQYVVNTIYKKAIVEVSFTNQETMTQTFFDFERAEKYAHTLIEDKNKIIVE